MSDVLFAVDSGSSPRMRGTRGLDETAEILKGIIPAYAGNTRPRQRGLLAGEDHPRVCGDHRPPARTVRRKPGSSPRMRGTLRISIRRNIGNGIIPAYAGNTFHGPMTNCVRRDHPRVCGEHRSRRFRKFLLQGSSPRMRGTRAVCDGESCRIRIIPAYAGNTCV